MVEVPAGGLFGAVVAAAEGGQVAGAGGAASPGDGVVEVAALGAAVAGEEGAGGVVLMYGPAHGCGGPVAGVPGLVFGVGGLAPVVAEVGELVVEIWTA
ncbi:hypothetical protein Acsp03_28300 [Actinomadura sp. NBRC 104412]|nr:hypothetical protein Acsp03_28300 [Actinomadura sp. NBRC 104412]